MEEKVKIQSQGCKLLTIEKIEIYLQSCDCVDIENKLRFVVC